MMQINYIAPNDNGTTCEWSHVPLIGTEAWECVDESITLTSEGSDNGDEDRIHAVFSGQRQLFEHSAWEPGNIAISSVRVRIQAKRTGTAAKIRPIIRLGGGDIIVDQAVDLAGGYATYTSNALGLPGGGNWSVADINQLEFGVESADVGRTDQPRVTRVYLVIEYEAGTHPAPTDLRIDEQSSPAENVGEQPLFSGRFNGAQSIDEATHVRIQVSEESEFGSLEWDSGWVELSSPCGDGARCEEQQYGGGDLSSDPPEGKHYARMRFKDGHGKESTWSAAARFAGIVHCWADSRYSFRRRMYLNRDHPDIPPGYVIGFPIETGDRENIADNGAYNEAVQASGGSQTERYQNVRHWVWLSRYGSDKKLGICVRSYDYDTGLWSEITRIDDANTAYDTHHFPSMVIDNNGYLHVFYGCHYCPIRYARSINPNDSSAWITGMTISVSGWHAYPIGLCVPSSGRIYVFCRHGLEKEYVFYYSDDGGSTWSSAHKYIENTSNKAFRCYQYGFRFEKTTNRLHIAWSDVDDLDISDEVDAHAMNVSYAYCDYDESAGEGFRDWHDITGTKVGTTDVDLLSRSDGEIIQSDAENEYFAMTVVLAQGSNPIVIFGHGHHDRGAQEPRSVVAARYDSGWQLSHITGQTGYEARVLRSGMPAICDDEDVLRCRYVIGGERHMVFVPTANGHYDQADKAGASEAYECVDDGIDGCDGDDTYIHRSPGAWKASFASATYSEIPSKFRVRAVTVEFLVRRTSSQVGNVGAFLRISGTDYFGGYGVSGYDAAHYSIREHTWLLNPATGEEWTNADACSVEFGCENGTSGASVRVTRVTKKVLVSTSVHPELFGGEILEARSVDSGATWTAHELTENSGIGMPIISMDIHHGIYGQEIAMIVTSGNDVLAVTEQESDGRVHVSGRDLAVFRQGSGSALELARVFAPYPNMISSTVRIPVPEQIPAGRMAGQGDLIVYYGNPDGQNDIPKADPNEVFGRGWDSFEELEEGESLHGKAGWLVVQGNAEVYASPPGHTNKVYAGHKSAKLGNDSIVSKSLGSELTNLLLRAGMWLEGMPADEYDRIRVELRDSGGSSFSVGIDYHGSCAGYQSGSSWTSVSEVKATWRQQHSIAIRVTPAGCSAWFDGNQIADEIPALTSAESVRLISPAFNTQSTPPESRVSFFDLIEVSHALWRRTAATISGDFTDNEMLFSASHGSSYEPDRDGKHDMPEYAGVFEITVKVRAKLNQNVAVQCTAGLHIWAGGTAIYDGSTVEDDRTTAVQLVYNSWVSVAETLGGLQPGEKSVKIDFYSVTGGIEGSDVEVEIEEIRLLREVHDPVAFLESEEALG